MRCRYCGTDLTGEEIVCPVCGTELQMVPDYNPLDDVLEKQIRGELNRTLVLQNARQSQEGSENGRTFQNTGMDDRARRRRQAERRRMQAKKKRQKLLFIGAMILVLAGIAGFFGYQNSYMGQVKKGYKLIDELEYNEAILRFQKAIKKNKKRSEAYTGMADVYIAQSDYEKGEQMYLQVLEEQPRNTELYKAAIQFYIETKQESKIAYLLKACEDDSVLKNLSDYQTDAPKFSLEESAYDDVQALEITSKGKAIYYTTDGSTPTISSKKYKNAIKLEEGVTEVKAIAINDAGIPSIVVSKKYTIVFPIADAPSVIPSTGQYDEPQQIRITVPDMYEAYYTMDGSEPEPDSSRTRKYTGEIDMPEGNTIFTAVLVDSDGRISDATIRNYELIIDDEE